MFVICGWGSKLADSTWQVVWERSESLSDGFSVENSLKMSGRLHGPPPFVSNDLFDQKARVLNTPRARYGLRSP